MTTVSPGNAGSSRGFRAVAARVSHAVPALCWAYMILSVPTYLGWQLGSRIALVPWIVTYATLIVALVHTFRDRMCLHCMRRTPLDPQAAVDRHRWALLAEHVLARFPLLTWAALVAVGAVSYRLVQDSGVKPLYALFDIALVSLCYVGWRHHHLQPWCPRCRGHWGDGGDPERVPEPDPVAKGTR